MLSARRIQKQWKKNDTLHCVTERPSIRDENAVERDDKLPSSASKLGDAIDQRPQDDCKIAYGHFGGYVGVRLEG